MAAASKKLDLEKIVTEWAWDQFTHRAPWKHRRMYRNEKKRPGSRIGIKIDWSDVDFSQRTIWSKLVDQDLKKATEMIEGVPQTVAADKTDEKEATPNGDLKTDVSALSQVDATQIPTTSKPHASVLFETKFTNNTKEVQQYTLRAEKTTRSTLTTVVENGFIKGVDVGLTLKTPGEILEANAGFHLETSVNTAEEETTEEELVWGAESVINVKGEHEAEAQLVVLEKVQKGNFTIKTHIEGTVRVIFTNIQDNNSFIKSTSHDIFALLRDYITKQRRMQNAMSFVELNDDDTVTISSEGTSNFRFGIRQEIRVDQTPLKPETVQTQTPQKSKKSKW